MRLRVTACSADAPYSPTPVTGYTVYRRSDPLPVVASMSAGPARAMLAGWEQVAKFDARGDAEILAVMPAHALAEELLPAVAVLGLGRVGVGLAQGLNKIGKHATVALRQPSLGPVFGMKGGATGGGRA